MIMLSSLGLPSPPKEIIPAPPAFPCQESGCKSTFSSMTQLQYHHNSVHIPAPPVFPCQESGCTSTFSSMTQLQYHHNSVHERPRPPRKIIILFET